ncbi:DUF6090 family protein [Maribacter sp. 4G9]|uniref:DUF6090 family protein n=1 Tax=Maribacter sp. 4G9 TaxID=1889777 RepID=UPI000C1566BD|nr:DUF6090 family protein [Maribacter sp. 4G9]PIB38165.1 hypothetical protein BFP75_17810 [Maribacter sp. 4G9]
MIKFFRKIRQKLLSENKFSKYLIYAIGEIILVVIGILIALQVNNWNENRKNNKVEENYLISLKDEFEFNKQNLTTTVTLNNRNANFGLQILKHTGPFEPKINNKTFDSLLVNTIGYEVEFRPRNEIINELISSGRIALINNSILRTELSSWAEALQRIRTQESEVSKYRFQLLDLTMKEINLRDAITNATGGIFGITESKFEKKNNQLLTSQEFESILTSFIGSSKFADQRFDVIDKKIDSILILIKKEIKK